MKIANWLDDFVTKISGIPGIVKNASSKDDDGKVCDEQMKKVASMAKPKVRVGTSERPPERRLEVKGQLAQGFLHVGAPKTIVSIAKANDLTSIVSAAEKKAGITLTAKEYDVISKKVHAQDDRGKWTHRNAGMIERLVDMVKMARIGRSIKESGSIKTIKQVKEADLSQLTDRTPPSGAEEAENVRHVFPGYAKDKDPRVDETAKMVREERDQKARTKKEQNTDRTKGIPGPGVKPQYAIPSKTARLKKSATASRLDEVTVTEENIEDVREGMSANDQRDELSVGAITWGIVDDETGNRGQITIWPEKMIGAVSRGADSDWGDMVGDERILLDGKSRDGEDIEVDYDGVDHIIPSKTASLNKRAEGSEGRYTSDEDIASEFEGFKIVKIEPKGLGGWINLEFPAGGEHVGGGTDELTDHYIIYDDGKIAFDNWYPDEVYNELVAEIRKVHPTKKEASRNKRAMDDDGYPEQTEAEQIAESFVNGNISWVRKQIGDSIKLYEEVRQALPESSLESFQRLMGTDREASLGSRTAAEADPKKVKMWGQDRPTEKIKFKRVMKRPSGVAEDAPKTDAPTNIGEFMQEMDKKSIKIQNDVAALDEKLDTIKEAVAKFKASEEGKAGVPGATKKIKKQKDSRIADVGDLLERLEGNMPTDVVMSYGGLLMTVQDVEPKLSARDNVEILSRVSALGKFVTDAIDRFKKDILEAKGVSQELVVFPEKKAMRKLAEIVDELADAGEAIKAYLNDVEAINAEIQTIEDDTFAMAEGGEAPEEEPTQEQEPMPIAARLRGRMGRVADGDDGDKLLASWDESEISEARIQDIKDDIDSESYDYIREGVKESGGSLDEAILEYVYNDSDIFQMEYEYFTERMDEIIADKGDGVWSAEGSNIGWQNQSGTANVEFSDFDGLRDKLLPKTSEMTIKVYDNGPNSFTMVVSRHDSPTGESYTVTAAEPKFKDGTKVETGRWGPGVVVESSFDNGWVYYVEYDEGSSGDSYEESELKLIGTNPPASQASRSGKIRTAEKGRPNNVDKCRDCAYFESGIGTVYHKCPECVNAYSNEELDGMDKADVEILRDYFTDRGVTTVNVPATDALPAYQKKHASLKKVARQNEEVVRMFLEDSFPKDKNPVWGTENLKITKKDSGWALVNYDTPLAYRDAEGNVFYNEDKYSVSTSSIQNKILGIAEDLGITMDVMDTPKMEGETKRTGPYQEMEASGKSFRMKKKASPRFQSRLALRNNDVAQTFFDGTFDKDKGPVRGTENLRITQMQNGWALVNYKTPIVYRDNEGNVFFNEETYSQSTSKIQSAIKGIAEQLGVTMDVVDGQGIQNEIEREGAYDDVDTTAGMSRFRKKLADGTSTHPLYTATCSSCGHKFEVTPGKIAMEGGAKCPKCGKKSNATYKPKSSREKANL